RLATRSGSPPPRPRSVTARISSSSADRSETRPSPKPPRARSRAPSMAPSDNRRLVVGVHPVLEVLAARGREVVQVFASHEGVLPQARTLGVPAERRQPAELDALAEGLRHQGAVALVGEYPYVDADALAARAAGAPLVLALDSVTDPQNLGALVRSAHVL